MTEQEKKEKEKLEKLKRIADKYGVDMEEVYPVSIEDCDVEFEEVDE